MTGLSAVVTDLMTSGTAPLAVRVLPGGPIAGGTALGAAAGLLGSSIIDRLLGDDDDAEGGDPLGDDADGGDPFGGDFDGGDGGDDGFGMDDFDDDDPFGDEGGDGGDTAELQERVDDLEGEVASLSSTVNTVRSENKEISETVDEIAEDVRGLLDIYEMVTRGINPFVDDDSLGGGGFEGTGGSLGLFDDGGGNDRSDGGGDDLDDDIAGAEAESFFDEDVLDDDSPDDTENDFDMTDDTSAGDSPGDGGGGKSFDELKAEYESGDAEWADDSSAGADAASTDLADAPSVDGGVEGDGSMGNGHDGATRNGRDDRPDARERPTGGNEGGFEFVGDGPGSAASKPYLTALPEGYVGDLIVIEWLESLVEESDPTDAARAVGYYERVEWISPDVADRLRDFLTGFGPIDANKVDDPGTETLTLDHHVRSLQYIRQLNGASAESLVIGRWDRISDGPGSVRDDRSGRDDGGRRSFLDRHPREVTDGR